MTPEAAHDAAWVVIGAGSAGCVATRRLVDAGAQVTLLEAGPPLLPDAIPEQIAGDNAFAALLPDRVHEGLLARRGRGRDATAYLRGRGVGGSSAVNAMVALRGDRELYRSWGWDDTDEAYERQLIPEHPADPHELGRVDRALLTAAPDATLVPLTRRDGRRITSAEAYLWPILDRFDLVTDVVVDRIETDASGAVDRVRLADGSVVAADRVVVAAGAIHSPAILLRSGLGGEHVGRGLQDHPAGAVLLDIDADPDGTELATATMVDDDPIQILALNHLGVLDGPGMLMVALMRPYSASGTVSLASDDPTVHPVVELDLLSDPRDLAALRSGVHRVLGLLDHDAFGALVRAVYIDDRGTGVDALVDDDAIDAWLLERGADYVHATSTCAMGRVVDHDGQVVGTRGVYVCDASVFPSIPDVNTHLPTTMVAERLSARWTPRR